MSFIQFMQEWKLKEKGKQINLDQKVRKRLRKLGLQRIEIKQSYLLRLIKHHKKFVEKEKQKHYVDKKRKVTSKEVKPGDQVLFKRDKSTIKSPWDPQPYQVVEVEGSKVIATRGAEKKARAKNHIKVVKERPPHLRLKGRQRVVQEDELDLEVGDNDFKSLYIYLDKMVFQIDVELHREAEMDAMFYIFDENEKNCLTF